MYKIPTKIETKEQFVEFRKMVLNHDQSCLTIDDYFVIKQIYESKKMPINIGFEQKNAIENLLKNPIPFSNNKRDYVSTMIKKYINQFYDHIGVAVAEIAVRSRKRIYSDYRQMAWRYCSENIKYNPMSDNEFYDMIGKLSGNFDRNTVRYGVNQIQNTLSLNIEYQSYVSQLTQKKHAKNYINQD